MIGRELDVAADAGAELIGINNRDLTTLAVDTRRTLHCSSTCPRVRSWSPSRVSARAPSWTSCSAAGVDGVLIGEALMRAARHRGCLPPLTGL